MGQFRESEACEVWAISEFSDMPQAFQAWWSRATRRFKIICENERTWVLLLMWHRRRQENSEHGSCAPLLRLIDFYIAFESVRQSLFEFFVSVHLLLVFGCPFFVARGSSSHKSAWSSSFEGQQFWWAWLVIIIGFYLNDVISFSVLCQNSFRLRSRGERFAAKGFRHLYQIERPWGGCSNHG